MKPLLASIPHAGEKLGPEAVWLQHLPEPLLMCDVDRFVDRLYQPVLDRLAIPHVITPWHRYMVDCNRWPSDIDCDSVEGAEHASGTHPTGLHWRVTTRGEVLIKKPLSKNVHQNIVQKYYTAFFNNIDKLYKKLSAQGAKTIYHLDLHSMPSKGTQAHRDPGAHRLDIIICTVDGQTAGSIWTDAVVSAFKNQGFEVGLNNPYKGGTVVQKYGRPQQGAEAIMIEINRKLYMDETTKQYLPQKAQALKTRLSQAVTAVWQNIPPISGGG